MPWECPDSSCGKEFSARGALISHIQNTACKRVMTDPVALASFLQMTDRLLCDTCQKTWSLRTVSCSCPGVLLGGENTLCPPYVLESTAHAHLGGVSGLCGHSVFNVAFKWSLQTSLDG
jgi:hypothetical protein